MKIERKVRIELRRFVVDIAVIGSSGCLVGWLAHKRPTLTDTAQ